MDEGPLWFTYRVPRHFCHVFAISKNSIAERKKTVGEEKGKGLRLKNAFLTFIYGNMERTTDHLHTGRRACGIRCTVPSLYGVECIVSTNKAQNPDFSHVQEMCHLMKKGNTDTDRTPLRPPLSMTCFNGPLLRTQLRRQERS